MTGDPSSVIIYTWIFMLHEGGSMEMKTIGLIGGLTWTSSYEYYRIINEKVREGLGGLSSAELIMHSVNFARINDLMYSDRWDEITDIMSRIASNLKHCGADFLIISCNAMHKVAEEISSYADIPLLHIAAAAGESIQRKGLKKIALLGSAFVMEQDFYKKPLLAQGLEVVIPGIEDRHFLQNVIATELAVGEVKESSKERAMEIIKTMGDVGAEGILLACTELPLLIRSADCDLALFNSGRIHALAAVEMALKE